MTNTIVHLSSLIRNLLDAKNEIGALAIARKRIKLQPTSFFHYEDAIRIAINANETETALALCATAETIFTDRYYKHEIRMLCIKAYIQVHEYEKALDKIKGFYPKQKYRITQGAFETDLRDVEATLLYDTKQYKQLISITEHAERVINTHQTHSIHTELHINEYIIWRAKCYIATHQYHQAIQTLYKLHTKKSVLQLISAKHENHIIALHREIPDDFKDPIYSAFIHYLHELLEATPAQTWTQTFQNFASANEKLLFALFSPPVHEYERTLRDVLIQNISQKYTLEGLGNMVSLPDMRVLQQVNITPPQNLFPLTNLSTSIHQLDLEPAPKSKSDVSAIAPMFLLLLNNFYANPNEQRREWDFAVSSLIFTARINRHAETSFSPESYMTQAYLALGLSRQLPWLDKAEFYCLAVELACYHGCFLLADQLFNTLVYTAISFQNKAIFMAHGMGLIYRGRVKEAVPFYAITFLINRSNFYHERINSLFEIQEKYKLEDFVFDVLYIVLTHNGFLECVKDYKITFSDEIPNLNYLTISGNSKAYLLGEIYCRVILTYAPKIFPSEKICERILKIFSLYHDHVTKNKIQGQEKLQKDTVQAIKESIAITVHPTNLLILDTPERKMYLETIGTRWLQELEKMTTALEEVYNTSNNSLSKNAAVPQNPHPLTLFQNTRPSCLFGKSSQTSNLFPKPSSSSSIFSKIPQTPTLFPR